MTEELFCRIHGNPRVIQGTANHCLSRGQVGAMLGIIYDEVEQHPSLHLNQKGPTALGTAKSLITPSFQ